MLWFFKGFLLNEDLFGVLDFMDVIPVYFTFQAGFPGGGLIKAASRERVNSCLFSLVAGYQYRTCKGQSKKSRVWI